MDKLLWFCVDKMEKELDLLYLSVKYQNVRNTTPVVQKLTETPFYKNNDQHDTGWGMEGGNFAALTLLLDLCLQHPLTNGLVATATFRASAAVA